MNIRMLMVCLIAIGTMAPDQNRLSLEAQLQAAIHRETVQGDLDGAIQEYKRVAEAARSNAPVAVQALLRLAACYEKRGDTQAGEVYERIIREYPGQADAVRAARARISRALGRRESRGAQPVERAIWSGNGIPLQAALTPDGRYLAYTDSSAKGNLALRDLETGDVRQLTGSADWSAAAPTQAGAAAISRDGKQIAYAWLVTGTVEGRESSHYQLRVRNVNDPIASDGRILYEHDENQWFEPAAWTPEGERILVSMRRPDNTRQLAFITVRDGSVSVLKTFNWRGGSSRPAMSPDGKWIAFDEPADEHTSQRDIWVLAVDGSDLKPVLTSGARETVAGWSPDGQHLLFMSDRRGPIGLWAQPMDGPRANGDPILVRADTRGFPLAVASASGAVCLLVMSDTRTIHTAPVDLLGGTRRGDASTPIVSPWPSVSQPRWSPDGRSIAFDTHRIPNAAPDGFLSVQSLDTRRIQEIPVKLTFMWDYQWAPDGQGFVARGTDYRGRQGIFRIDMTGEVSPIELARPGEILVGARLSPDGSTAYYARLASASGTRAAVIRDLRTGSVRELPLPYPGRFAGFSPDGRFAAGVQSDGNATYLWVFSVTDEKARRILKLDRRNAIRGVDWVHDGSALVISRAAEAPRSVELWRVPVGEGQPHKLDADVRKMIGPELALHPDGSQVAFLAGEPLKFEIRLLENYLPGAALRGTDSRRQPD